MKPRNNLEVKGAVTVGALALALWTLPALAAEPDGHAFVRDSIRNTWTPNAVAPQTEGKTDAHERARTLIVGAPKFLSTGGVTSVSVRTSIDAHDQARRLLVAQPMVRGDRTRSGS